jgi:hypothetical protein
MWLKVLKMVWTAAVATGLDKKAVEWIKSKVVKSKNKYDDKALEAAEFYYELKDK